MARDGDHLRQLLLQHIPGPPSDSEQVLLLCNALCETVTFAAGYSSALHPDGVSF